jgi:hypothetical protein
MAELIFRLELANPDKALVEKYLNIFYEVPVELTNYVEDIPMSTVQEICIRNQNDLSTTIQILEGSHTSLTSKLSTN